MAGPWRRRPRLSLLGWECRSAPLDIRCCARPRQNASTTRRPLHVEYIIGRNAAAAQRQPHAHTVRAASRAAVSVPRRATTSLCARCEGAHLRLSLCICTPSPPFTPRAAVQCTAPQRSAARGLHTAERGRFRIRPRDHECGGRSAAALHLAPPALSRAHTHPQRCTAAPHPPPSQPIASTLSPSLTPHPSLQSPPPMLHNAVARPASSPVAAVLLPLLRGPFEHARHCRSVLLGLLSAVR